MLRTSPKQLSLYSLLYDNIPENRILKTIHNAIDLKFVNKLLQSSYCKYYGRPKSWSRTVPTVTLRLAKSALINVIIR